jgi:hypothetical protein
MGADYRLGGSYRDDSTGCLTSLHILANEGLATACKLLLHLKENQNDTYLLELEI